MSASNNFKKHLKGLADREKGLVALLAARLGKSRSLIYSYIKSDAVPNLDTAEEVALAAGTSLSEMIGKEKPKFVPVDSREPTDAELAVRMIERFGIRGVRLDLIRFALLSEDVDVKLICEQLPALDLSALAGAGKKRKGSSGA